MQLHRKRFVVIYSFPKYVRPMKYEWVSELFESRQAAVDRALMLSDQYQYTFVQRLGECVVSSATFKE